MKAFCDSFIDSFTEWYVDCDQWYGYTMRQQRIEFPQWQPTKKELYCIDLVPRLA